jgi:hypothetical protein
MPSIHLNMPIIDLSRFSKLGRMYTDLTSVGILVLNAFVETREFVFLRAINEPNA